MKKLIAVMCLVSAPAAANDDYYLTLGAGKSHLENPGKVWHNFEPTVSAGYASTDNDHSNTWSIGFGKKYGWGSVEIAYHDFGSSGSDAGYPYDPGYVGPGAPAGCVWPCDLNTQWVYHYGSATGISLTALPEYKFGKDSAVYLRAGGVFYKAKFEYFISNEQGIHNSRTFDYHGGWENKGLSGVLGLGLRLGDISIEATHYPTVESKADDGTPGHFQRVSTLTVNFRKGF